MVGSLKKGKKVTCYNMKKIGLNCALISALCPTGDMESLSKVGFNFYLHVLKYSFIVGYSFYELKSPTHINAIIYESQTRWLIMILVSHRSISDSKSIVRVCISAAAAAKVSKVCLRTHIIIITSCRNSRSPSAARTPNRRG